MTIERRKALWEQVMALYREGRYGDAIPLAEEFHRLGCEEEGEEALDCGHACNILGLLRTGTSDYAKAEAALQEAIRIYAAVEGEAHPDYAASLNNLGELYRAMGAYDRAELLYRQSLEAKRGTVGEDDPSYATGLNNLGCLYDAMGDYGQAERSHRQALDIRRRALGENHPDYAQSLNNLAEVHRKTGNLSAAEPLFRQAIQICRKAFGERHPVYATYVNNLALVYTAMGDAKQAEALYREALAVLRKVFGERHPEYARVLDNLAMLYNEAGEYAKAEPLRLQALEIRRDTLGEDHPDYARTLSNLAVLYRNMGKNYRDVEPLLRKALETGRKTLSKQHVEYATFLQNQALVYDDVGEWAKAEALYREALDVYRQGFGEDHPQYANTLTNMAILYACSLDDASAESAFRGVMGIMGRVSESVSEIASERQRLAFYGRLAVFLDLALSFVHAAGERLEGSWRWGLELLLRFKGASLEAGIQQSRLASDLQVGEASGKLEALAEARRRIAALSLAVPSAQGARKPETDLAHLYEQKESLERDLSRLSARFAKGLLARRADAAAVATALPAGAALVEIARPRIYHFGPKSEKPSWRSARYLAFVLLSGNPEPVAADLGDADEMDREIETFRQAIAAEKSRYQRGEASAAARDIGVTARTAAKTEQGVSDCALACRRLYDRIFAPLEGHLQGVKTLYVSPDGAMNLLSFGALVDQDYRYLIERYRIAYLTSGRDLLRESAGQGDGTAVFADPDFDAGSSRAGAAPQRPDHAAALATRAAEEGMLHWPPLPATRMEARTINSLFLADQARTPTVYMREEASESRLKGIARPRILHLATHGYFFRDLERPEEEVRPGAVAAGGEILGRIARVENPMLQSGLVLSGANRLLRGEAVEGEDGWVTAEDVAGLDLTGTELAVLSACETGLGHVQRGEGVMGLRRAFRLAGARSLVMSLWKVPDQETQELMVDFYGRYKAAGNAPDALRGSMLQALAEARQRGVTLHPFYWAAFICEGGVTAPAEAETSGQRAVRSSSVPETAHRALRTADSLVVRCPLCRKAYRVSASQAGKRARCKSCNTAFMIAPPGTRPRRPAEPSRRPAPVDRRQAAAPQPARPMETPAPRPSPVSPWDPDRVAEWVTRNLGTDPEHRIFLPEDLSPKRRGGLGQWFVPRPAERLLLVIDTTTFGNCKTGVALTDRRLVWRMMMEQMASVPFTAIEAVSVRKDKLFVRTTTQESKIDFNLEKEAAALIARVLNLVLGAATG